MSDSLYSTPHEAALAVVATAMKKSRQRLDTLVLNSILGGILFSTGSFLFVGFQSENPEIMDKNPGVAQFIGALFFGIGLFFTIIMGVDLYNSNILFFSVGVMRGAVTIYDLIVSWFVSWVGNIAGCLFYSYVFMYLSGSGATKLWSEGSRKVLEGKLSFSFIQIFLKGIAGNFYVCLAVYLQLMAKPLHVRYIVMTLPIFTFVSLSFSHSVADMSIAYIGLLNGAHATVGKYIWKLLIASSVGNIVGGSAFGIVIPFYLHLFVVEADQKKLAMPKYEEKDEQPDLNTDSRVIRVKTKEIYTSSPNDELEDDTSSESLVNDEVEKYVGTSSPDDTPETHRKSSQRLADVGQLSRVSSRRSNKSLSSRKFTASISRTPTGVFPILGMEPPLSDSKTFQNSKNDRSALDSSSHNDRINDYNSLGSASLHGRNAAISGSAYNNRNKSEYNVEENKSGAALQRVVTTLSNKFKSYEVNKDILPKTTQEAFAFNDPMTQQHTNEQHQRSSNLVANSIIQSVDSYQYPEDIPTVD